MSDPYDEPNRRSASETRERLATIEARMTDRWEWVRHEFTKLERRLSELELAVKGYTPGPRSSPIATALKDQQWLLIAALVLGAMLGKAGINPIEWILR